MPTPSAKLVDELNGKAGLLWQWGALDFAGGTVVHINAGVAGLVGAYMVGKRIGYGKEAMPPHNLPMTMIGASLLWVGWFGFNAGSGARSRQLRRARLHQHLPRHRLRGAVVDRWSSGCSRASRSMLGAASGAVAGLVAITPAAGNVGIAGAFVIGIAAGIVCLWGVTGLKKHARRGRLARRVRRARRRRHPRRAADRRVRLAGSRRAGLRRRLGHGTM